MVIASYNLRAYSLKSTNVRDDSSLAVNFKVFHAYMNRRFQCGIPDFMDRIPDFMEKFSTF